MMLVQKGLGLLMIFMAMWLLSRIAFWSTIMIYSAALIIAAILYGVFVHRNKFHPPLAHRFGFIVGLFTIFILGAIALPSVETVATMTQKHLVGAMHPFKIIRSVNDLNTQLELARAANKPVMVDFYADWCESCIVMDKKVFSHTDVLKQLTPFILLRADLSANNANDEALLKQYDVIAPPTVLFFNNQGNEVATHRIVGELEVNEFLSRINTFFSANCDTKLLC
jgi:thiol:disulfide interchange protein DsbD